MRTSPPIRSSSRSAPNAACAVVFSCFRQTSRVWEVLGRDGAGAGWVHEHSGGGTRILAAGDALAGEETVGDGALHCTARGVSATGTCSSLV